MLSFGGTHPVVLRDSDSEITPVRLGGPCGKVGIELTRKANALNVVLSL